jgi:hypothetical protein
MFSERTGAQAGALSGVVFAVCVFLGNGALVGDSSSTDPAADLYQLLSDTAAIQMGVFFSALSVVFALWFAASLRSVLAQSEGEPARLANLALAAIVGGTVMSGIGPATMRGVTLRINEATSTPDLAAFAHTITAGLFFYSAMFFGVAALATAVVSLRYPAMPRWYGWLALALGLAMLVGGLGSAIAPAWGFIGSLGLLMFFVVTPFVLVRRVPLGRPQ